MNILFTKMTVLYMYMCVESFAASGSLKYY